MGLVLSRTAQQREKHHASFGFLSGTARPFCRTVPATLQLMPLHMQVGHALTRPLAGTQPYQAGVDMDHSLCTNPPCAVGGIADERTDKLAMGRSCNSHSWWSAWRSSKVGSVPLASFAYRVGEHSIMHCEPCGGASAEPLGDLVNHRRRSAFAAPGPMLACNLHRHAGTPHYRAVGRVRSASGNGRIRAWQTFQPLQPGRLR